MIDSLTAQQATPLLDALQIWARKSHAPFYTPGHKRGQGAPQILTDCLGQAALQMDLPELPDLDNLFVPQGVIQAAQELAAAAFGAEKTWFLVNGSTCVVIAAILATCHPGDRILLPRNIHQSVISGLILSGAVPVFVEPEYDPIQDLVQSITPARVAAALVQYPDLKAVMMVYPTYHGICGDVAEIAQVAHQHGIPLLVDEAHGPHFAFHPDLPTAALAAGADLTVQSTHKVLSALTQAAMLHVQGRLIDPERVRRALQLVQSTSPNYLLLASLDTARQQMAVQGELLLTRTLQLSDEARTRISQLPGLTVLERDDRYPSQNPGFLALDRTRLTVSVSGLGTTGFAVDELFHQELGVTAELPSLQHLTFIISLGNTSDDIERLVQAFATLIQTHKPEVATLPNHPLPVSPVPVSLTPAALTPREAFFAASQTLPIEQTIGRISAELVCPYPPGIPVLMPGEAIAADAIAYLKQVLAAGGLIAGCADPNLQTLRVVEN